MLARSRRGPHLLMLALMLVIAMASAGAAATAATCFGREPTITGSDGPDTLSGTPGGDVILGLGGNDTISGGGGSDFICGGLGNDVILGGSGRDRLAGEGGADRLEGGTGDDRLLGGSGSDRLEGGEGSDATNGGGGIDTCLSGETLTSCELTPPAGCTNPPRVPAAARATNVTVAGSNAFTTWASFGIDGEYERLHFRAELRNATGSSIRLGKVYFRVYDSGGALLATRWARAQADSLAPGQRTVVTETMPSTLYWDDEDNFFPENWASWELEVSATFGAATTWDEVVIGSRLTSLAPEPDGDLLAQGTATNTRGVAIDNEAWWVVLYDERGRLINASTAILGVHTALAPGASAPFTAEFDSDEPNCFATSRAGAAGS